jgi:hypothetical protein
MRFSRSIGDMSGENNEEMDPWYFGICCFLVLNIFYFKVLRYCKKGRQFAC